MKNILTPFITFSRTERMGLVGLLIVLALLIVVRTTMHLWVPSPVDEAKQQQLVAAWQDFQKNNTKLHYFAARDTAGTPATTRPKPTVAVPKHAVAVAPQSHLFKFDPNTLDSAGFRRLGLREKTTAILLHWRAKGKHFYHRDELKKVYTLTPEDYDRLEPYISIAPN